MKWIIFKIGQIATFLEELLNELKFPGRGFKLI